MSHVFVTNHSRIHETYAKLHLYISKMMPATMAEAAPSDQSTDSAIDKDLKTPSKLSPEPPSVQWTRRWILLSFWAVVVLLGLPIWWKTTAIYRADLPLQDMTDWANGRVKKHSQLAKAC